MRHFSLFDDMDDGFKKKTADDKFFTIDLGSENALLGLMDVCTWTRENGNVNDFTDLAEYLNDLYSSEDYTLRINAEQFSQIRIAFYDFMNYIEQFKSKDEFETLYPDFEIEDIFSAEKALMMAQMDPSSNDGLENIPTMDRNPEDLKEGELPTNIKEVCPNCGQGNTFSTVDEFGEVRCDNCGALDPNDMGDICPECSNEHSITVDEFGERRCNSCGWAEEREHDVPEGPSPVAPVTPAAKNQAQVCPICKQNAINPKTNQCTVCEWDGDNACPKCHNDKSLKSDENGYRSCTNCGWMEEDIQQRAALEEQYKLPATEHPLGPHTGADNLNNQYYTIPIDTNGNEVIVFSIFVEWGETYGLIPNGFMNSLAKNGISTNEQGGAVLKINGSTFFELVELANTFLQYGNAHFEELIKSLSLTSMMVSMAAQMGVDVSNADQASVPEFKAVVVEVIQEIAKLLPRIVETNPDPSSGSGIEEAYNAPSVEHPLGPHTGAEGSIDLEPEKEFYTSGRFVNTNPDRFGPKQWGVIVNPASGQRAPEPGDWAEIAQKTKSYARPVPITLVDQVSDQTWTFKNGHHPSI